VPSCEFLPSDEVFLEGADFSSRRRQALLSLSNNLPIRFLGGSASGPEFEEVSECRPLKKTVLADAVHSIRISGISPQVAFEIVCCTGHGGR
jgi:hypothetical protein